MGRGKAELHFYEDREMDRLSTTAMCSLYVDNSQALFEEWSTIIVPDERTGSCIVAPQAADCGMRELAVVERSGNLLRIGSAVDPI